MTNTQNWNFVFDQDKNIELDVDNIEQDSGGDYVVDSTPRPHRSSSPIYQSQVEKVQANPADHNRTCSQKVLDDEEYPFGDDDDDVFGQWESEGFDLPTPNGTNGNSFNKSMLRSMTTVKKVMTGHPISNQTLSFWTL